MATTVPIEQQKNIADAKERIREQLALGTAATADAGAFATAAQGGKADTAVQPAAMAEALAAKLDADGAADAVISTVPGGKSRALASTIFDIINPADFGAEIASAPVSIGIPAGQSRFINNAAGYNVAIGLAAGAEAWVLEPGGMRHYQPGNVPVADGSSAFVGVSKSLDIFSNGDVLADLSLSIDDFGLPFGTYRIEAGSLGTFPNSTDKAGFLFRFGKPTDIKDVLYTDTFGVFMRRATLSSGVMVWGSWVACGPTPATAGAWYLRIGSKYQFPLIADDGVGVIDLGAAMITPVILRVADNNASGGQFLVRAGESPQIRPTGVTTTSTPVAAVNTALTGTTGADGSISVGCDETGKIYIENRSGSGRLFLAWLERY